jgi:hypothetical protein
MESMRAIEPVGTDAEEPSLNADFGTEVSTSSSVSQSPDEIVVPVVESAYQHADSPALRVTLLSDVVPCVPEATLFVVHAVSDECVVSRR